MTRAALLLGLPIASQGCKPVVCKSPANLTEKGYTVLLGLRWRHRKGRRAGTGVSSLPRFENSKKLPDFNVKAECADKYMGTPTITPCESHGEEYTITGRLTCRVQVEYCKRDS